MKKSDITWARTGNGLPPQPQDRPVYQGVNVLLLYASAMTHGYSSDRWLTYKQAADMGRPVRKGEKSVTCVFFKTLECGSENEGDSTEKADAIRVIKPFWLCNLHQIDDIEKPQAAAQLNEFQQIDTTENV